MRIVSCALLFASMGVAAVPTVVLVGGLSGRDNSIAAIEKAVKLLDKRSFNLESLALANPEGEELVFPPTGVAYRQNGRSHMIWRWLGLHAPDLVIVVGERDFGLTAALGQNAVAGMGRIPAIRVSADRILPAIPEQIAESAAHRERNRRLARTPHEVAKELSKFYGHDFDQAVYIQAMALIGRVRLGQQDDVATLVAPFIDGLKDSLANATPSHLAGHLIFAELARRTGDARYADRVRAAADLALSGMSGKTEMSDAVFMDCPILAAAGRFDMALQHLRFMQKLCLRGDGLYRHSPLNEAAWGRGNAFPALGVSWALLYIPDSHSVHPEMVRALQEQMRALEKFQDRDGMWHEVIDRTDSYPEFSATAMIAAAMLRGVRHGWLDRSYEARVQAAWRGILTRIGPDGEVVDVCESTGKQKSVEDYLKRAASLGTDARGGGMALLLASEMSSQAPSASR